MEHATATASASAKQTMLCHQIQPNILSLESYLSNIKYINIGDRLNLCVFLVSSIHHLE